MSEIDGQRLAVRLGKREAYEIFISGGTLERAGEIVRRSLPPHAQRIAIISNARVFDLYGEQLIRSLRAAEFPVSYWLMGDGERFKSLRSLEKALKFLAQSRIERGDAVIALGGGVVGDLTGFAAAVYLRGVPYVQVPTTLLAQIDSSVGGKTAVNAPYGKNVIGAFHQPRVVIIDPRTLRTLPRRELTSGWCEAVKQGAIGSRMLFDKTRRFLADEAGAREFGGERIAELISAQCAFKARIVRGDEREELNRTDARSRRVLNFGHTVGHALEKVTHYRRFRHGEAVGYGMLAAGEISKRLGFLDVSELELLKDAIGLAGRLPPADDLDEKAIAAALKSDKKSLGGAIQWVLLERIGQPRIVSGKQISSHVLLASLRTSLQQTS